MTRAVVCSSAGQVYQASLIDIKIDASCVVWQGEFCSCIREVLVSGDWLSSHTHTHTHTDTHTHTHLLPSVPPRAALPSLVVICLKEPARIHLEQVKLATINVSKRELVPGRESLSGLKEMN